MLPDKPFPLWHYLWDRKRANRYYRDCALKEKTELLERSKKRIVVLLFINFNCETISVCFILPALKILKNF